jgi:hypothetical protein
MESRKRQRQQSGSGEAARVTTTDRIVEDALEEEQRDRHRRLGTATGRGHGEDFLSDSDVDVDDEGIDDDADAAERARRAKETERDVREAEEVFDAEKQRELKEDHGIELEAFNMVEERALGQIDEEGNYVGREAGRASRRGHPASDGASDGDSDSEGGGGEEDGWLDGNQDKLVVDDATREKIETQRKQLEQEEQERVVAGPAELARWQYAAYKILKDEETVASALKRLAGPGNKRFVGSKKRLERELAKRSAGGKKQGQTEDEKKAFDELTECATLLMNAGDVDVYGRDRAYFKRAASLYIDVSDGEDGGREEDEDMFS